MEFAKMCQQFIKIKVFPAAPEYFFIVPKPNEQEKKTMLRVSNAFWYHLRQLLQLMLQLLSSDV